jgi:hypothetical protein
VGALKSAPIAAIVASLLCAACTTGQVGTLPAQHGPLVSQDSLEVGVGTATIANLDGSSHVGLNVVATFRQPSGQNATLENTPTLAGPASFGGSPNVTGVTPNAVEAAAAASASPPPGEFGSEIGAFGYGLAPLNLLDVAANSKVFGSSSCDGLVGGNYTDSIRYDEFYLPLSFTIPCSSVTTPIYDRMQYYGGPPAWPSPQGYGIPEIPGDEMFHGYPFGFTDFYDVTPVAGTYTLGVAFPVTSDGSSYANVIATATLKTLAALAVFAPPIVRIQPDGSAYVNVDVPAGATEAIVSIAATACSKDSSGNELPVRYFSLLTHQAGPQTLLLSSNLGAPDATGAPTDTFCTAADDQAANHSNGHSFDVGAVAFDYPAFEASYPQSTNPKPAIVGFNGQADISTASPQLNVAYALASQ